MWMARRSAGALVAILVSGSLVAACWPFNSLEDCEQNPLLSCYSSGAGSGSSSGGGGTPAGCVPSENATPVADTCGVFVSSSLGGDANAGTKTAPLKTLLQAIDKANGRPVYACAEEFGGSVTLTSGVAIYGGLDCTTGWAYVGATTRSTLMGDVDEVALTVGSDAVGAELVDFTIRAADAVKDGGSSIAVLADGATAEFVRCDLRAGVGAKGAAGAPGDANGKAAAGGVPGNAGKDACSDLDAMGGPDTTLPGGAQVTNDCGGEVSIGGRGGDGNVPNGGGADAGQSGTAGQAGVGEPAMGMMWSCIAGSGLGNAGSPGDSGAAGSGATGLGSISASGYAGASGGAGTPGKAGQGGGGGGGAKGGMICAGGVSGSGASGGSGGAGGCGGLAGTGGGPGGASIALVSLNASITLTDCTLSSNKGGDGGPGGDLQPGGPGGLPGLGGQGVGGSNPGCSGGQGGKGGNGGPGGGGLGGPSIGIAFIGNPVDKSGTTSITPGAPGAGGPGGSVNVAMNAGESGKAAEEQSFPE